MEFQITQKGLLIVNILFTQRWENKKLKAKCVLTPNMNESKWQLPWFYLHVFTKSCRGWEPSQRTDLLQFIFDFGKWCHVRCSNSLNISTLKKKLWQFPLCLMHVSTRFCLSTATSPTPLILGPDFRGCASYSGAGWLRVKHHVTYIQGHGWTFFSVFLSAHFYIASTATIKLFHHFYFVWMLNLGYAVPIFHTTVTKYVMFCVSWSKSLKGSVTPDECIITVCGSKCF